MPSVTEIIWYGESFRLRIGRLHRPPTELIGANSDVVANVWAGIVHLRIGFTAQTLFGSRYRLSQPAGKYYPNVLLAPLESHESARVKPILQHTVNWTA
jgi:hypothetical protein